MIATLMIAVTAAAAAPSTADLKFMIGEWRLEGAFNPGSNSERKETGTQRCAFVMGGAYVRCDRRMRSADGREREQVSFHNYNGLYGRFEHLFISSNWPTKVIGHSQLVVDGQGATMEPITSFVLPDGRTEQVRSVDRYQRDRLESNEQLRVGASATSPGQWRTNYRLTGTKAGN